MALKAFRLPPACLPACTWLVLCKRCASRQDNFLTGTVPIGITNSALISLRATNNKFTSSIPDAVWKLPVLTTIDLGNNE